MYKQKCFILMALFLGLTLQALHAQKLNLDDKIPFDPSITTGKLANGLTYYIKKNSKPEKRLEIRLAVNAGSICESEEQRGLAHFCEHMCFNGTKNFKKAELVNTLERMGIKFGAELNAYTSFDETVYKLSVPTDKEELVEKGFQVMEDWAHQVSFDTTEINKERGVVLEEWRLGLGANDRMLKKYFPVLLKGSLYAERLPIGKPEVIQNFKPQTVVDFYKEWYRPELMAVVVVGDIEVAEAEKMVRKHFEGIEPRKNGKARVEAEIPDNKEPLISIVTDKEATRNAFQIYIKQNTRIQKTLADYRSQLAVQLYNSMINKRLYELRMKPETPFLGAYTEMGDFLGRTKDAFTMSAVAKENQILESVELVLRENYKVKQFGFTQGELDRAKIELLSGLEQMAAEADKTPSDNLCGEYVRNFMVQECVPGIKKEYELSKEMLPTIVLDEVNAFSAQWIKDDNMAIVVTVPEKEGVKVPTQEEILNALKNAKAAKLEAYKDAAENKPLLANMPKAGKVKKCTENKDFGFTELSLSNGVKVLLKPTDFKNDEIKITAFSFGGGSNYGAEDALNVNLSAPIIGQSGVGDFDQVQLNKILTGKIAYITFSIDNLKQNINGSCAPKDLETWLQLNYLYATQSHVDKNAFDVTMSSIRNNVKFMANNPKVLFQDTLTKLVTLNDPRSIVLPTDKQLATISKDRIQAIFKERFSNANGFTYILVGNFKTDEIIPKLEQYLGGLPSNAQTDKWKDVSPRFPSGIVKLDYKKNSEPQSSISITMKGTYDWNEKEKFVSRMMTDILNIKLREAIREDEGGTYGINVGFAPSLYPKKEYVFSINFGCKPENVQKLIEKLFAEVKKIADNGPTADDMNKVTETLIREREKNDKENAYWLAIILNRSLLNADIYSFEGYSKMVKSVTPEDIKKALKKYFTPDHYVQGVLLPEEN